MNCLPITSSFLFSNVSSNNSSKTSECSVELDWSNESTIVNIVEKFIPLSPDKDQAPTTSRVQSQTVRQNYFERI